MLHAAILRSPHAHARIIAIDATQALALPGVVAVFTFQDIAPLAKPIPLRLYPLPGLEQFLQYPLARDKVRYVGEPLAIVVAESRYLAEDGLDAMDVTYEPLPVVTDVRQALQQQIIIHEAPATNLASRYTLALGDIEEAFHRATYTRKEVFKVPPYREPTRDPRTGSQP
jgi:aerobic carbon-monoxide dehydrogenase large subunit